jgi:hypothetical protein
MFMGKHHRQKGQTIELLPSFPASDLAKVPFQPFRLPADWLTARFDVVGA